MSQGRFEVSTEVLENRIHHITVHGELDLDTAPEMEASLRASRTTDGVSVLVDFSECDFIDSSGFALIVRAWRDLENKSGDERLVMCCAADQVKRLLKITGADEAIPIHDNADEALADLRGQSEPARSV